MNAIYALANENEDTREWDADGVWTKMENRIDEEMKDKTGNVLCSIPPKIEVTCFYCGRHDYRIQ